MAENPTEPGEFKNPHRSGTGCAGLRSLPALGFVTVLALLAGLTGCYTRMDVAIPPQNVARATPPEKPLTAVLTLRGGNGPFPAIVVLHGCDSVQEQEQAGAGRLNGWGYAALIVDSFAPRSFIACGMQGEIPPLTGRRNRAGDALSAALWLRTMPEIDGRASACSGPPLAVRSPPC